MFSLTKIWLIVVLLTAFFKLTKAQVEYMPNGGFEQYSELPDFVGQIDRSQSWFNPMFEECVWSVDSCSTSDFFHLQGIDFGSLSNNPFASVQPYEGLGIAGLAAIVNWGGKEFISSQFSTPMVHGGRYKLSMFISNGIPNVENGTGWGLDDLGIGLSTQEPIQYHYATSPPASVTVFTIDTVFFSENWVEHSIIFIADSNYQYLTIGNFKEGENEMVPFYPENSMFDVAYYFIDNVSVIRLDTANSVYEWQEAVRSFSQSAEQIGIGLNAQVRNATAMLYDMAGRETGRANGNGSSLSLPIGHLPKGIYALRLQTDVGAVSRKVVIP